MDDEMFNKIYNAICDKGKYKDFNISYAMDNDLDDILVQGKVRIEYGYTELKTDVLVNPTYLDAVVAINDLMNIGIGIIVWNFYIELQYNVDFYT